MAPENLEEIFEQTGGFKDFYFDTDEGEIHALSGGNSNSNVLLAFIHGSPGSAFDFVQFADSFQLDLNHQLLFFDRPGYGKSTHPHTGNLHDQALWITRAIKDYNKYLKVDRVIVFGHSYGGPVAMQMGVENPNLINGLVLAAPTIALPMQEPRWYNNIATFFLVKPLLGKWLRNSNSEMTLLYESELLQLEDKLADYQGPIEFIQGGADVLVPAESAGYFRFACPSCNVNFIRDEEMNHFIPWTHPKYLMQALEQIVDTLNSMSTDSLKPFED